jgi:uncharacterized protein (DUF885 family)
MSEHKQDRDGREKLTAQNKTVWIAETTSLLRTQSVSHHVTAGMTLAAKKKKTMANLKRFDKVDKATLDDKKEIEELLADRAATEEDKAKIIIMGGLLKGDKLEVIDMTAKEMWKYCNDMGEATKEDQVEYLEKLFNKIRFHGCKNMKGYTDKKRSAYYDIENAKKGHLPEKTMMSKTLEHIGKEKKPGGKFREIYVKLKDQNREETLDWSTMVAKLKLAEQDEGSDDEDSDNEDDDRDEASFTRARATETPMEKGERLHRELDLWREEN